MRQQRGLDGSDPAATDVAAGAPGKVARTDQLVQRKASPAAAPVEGAASEPEGRATRDDAFAMHLLTPDVQLDEDEGGEHEGAFDFSDDGGGGDGDESLPFMDVLQQSAAPEPQAALQMKGGGKPPKAVTPFRPEVVADTGATTIGIGKTAKLKFRVKNAKKAPRKTKFVWHQAIQHSGAISIVGHKLGSGPKSTLKIKGEKPGIEEFSTSFKFETPDGQTGAFDTPKVRLEVGPHLDSAEAELDAIDRLDNAGGKVSEVRRETARNEAVAAAQEEMTKASGDAGVDIGQTVSLLHNEIDQIQDARARGYGDALSHLDLQQLDKGAEANVKGFVLSLIGNLTWALSGLVSLTPQGLSARLLLGFLAKNVAARGAVLSTIVGTGGAMLAQFANGLPSSTNATHGADDLIKLQSILLQVNSDLCNQRRTDLYHLIVDAMQEAPPDETMDAQKYAAELRVGLRHLLYGQYYVTGAAGEKGLNAAAIQTDARNQLLRQLVVSTSKIEGGKLKPMEDEAGGMGKFTEDALRMIDGPEGLKLGAYELLDEQHARVREVLRITADKPSKYGSTIAAGKSVKIPAAWRGDAKEALFGGKNPLWDQLVMSRQVSLDPPLGGPGGHMADVGLKLENFPQLDSIEIEPWELESGDVAEGGKTAYSARSVRITANGVGIAGQADGPVAFIYRLT